ncbi:MAG TPA: helix-turn-helix domain-containing protein [Bacillota bacterium]|jgi:excisionase family DNA binding protein|nr:helix-turn-helix domain-containing protein [Bacillota bacterium]
MSERLAYSVKEFRKKTGLSKNLTYKLLETGTLKSVRAGRRILIPAWAVEDFLRKAK